MNIRNKTNIDKTNIKNTRLKCKYTTFLMLMYECVCACTYVWLTYVFFQFGKDVVEVEVVTAPDMLFAGTLMFVIGFILHEMSF